MIEPRYCAFARHNVPYVLQAVSLSGFRQGRGSAKTPNLAGHKKNRMPKTGKKTELIPVKSAGLVPSEKRDSLTAWLSIYMRVEGAAGSLNTFRAKKRDLEDFLGFVART